ncbi:MAG: four helix bundle protein [Alphaproteobacteria bacterium]|nr:four helix bundle protein [Alphaproteobacteria bacterium]
MSRDSVTLEKSKKFSARIIRLDKYLREKKCDRAISNQILRSGTSICANLSEAIYGISRGDFLHKTHIALKECAETMHWLEMLKESGDITSRQFESMKADCEELLKLLIATTKTTRNKLKISSI